MPLISRPSPPEAGVLLAKLLEINARHNYIPENELRSAAKELGVSLSQMYSIACFYKAIRLIPRGRHIVNVCLGTACHVRGGELIMEQAKQRLGIEEGGTTSNQKLTLEKVNCRGCCAFGPVMTVDGEFHGKISASDAKDILEKYD